MRGWSIDVSYWLTLPSNRKDVKPGDYRYYWSRDKECLGSALILISGSLNHTSWIPLEFLARRHSDCGALLRASLRSLIVIRPSSHFSIAPPLTRISHQLTSQTIVTHRSRITSLYTANVKSGFIRLKGRIARSHRSPSTNTIPMIIIGQLGKFRWHVLMIAKAWCRHRRSSLDWYSFIKYVIDRYESSLLYRWF